MPFKNETFFFVIFLVLVTLTAGCSLLPFPGPSVADAPEKVDIGFSSTPASSAHVVYSFDRFHSVFSAMQFGNESNMSANETPERNILYIRGLHMDESGNAESWIAVVREGNITSMISYDKFGEKISGSVANEKLPAIPMDRILIPARLFEQNHNIIFNNPQDASSDPVTLELAESSYTLTIPGQGTTRILKFNALTGALIESNE